MSYRCARPTSRRGVVAGASLRQTNGARAERTNSAGAALLDFDRLPSCFIVSVTGGRVNGRAVRGSFHAEAWNEGDQIMSVLVTPVSTLTYAVRRARPGMSTARATRVVHRLLAIPAHFDHIDLAADDTPFDGDRYMAAALRAGGIGKLNRALIRTAQRDRRHPFRAKKARAAAAPPGDDPLGLREWWKQTDVTKLVKDGLKDFGLSLVSEGIQVGGKWVLGRLLDYWGLKDVKEFLLPKPDTEKIIEMIQELTKRVNNLQRDLRHDPQGGPCRPVQRRDGADRPHHRRDRHQPAGDRQPVEAPAGRPWSRGGDEEDPGIDLQARGPTQPD